MCPEKTSQVSAGLIDTGIERGSWRAWLLAARVKTLGAGAVPVVTASALAYPRMSVLTLLACLIGALGFQVASNFVNDAADFEKGADNDERVGPPRAAQLGLLKPSQLYFGAAVFVALSFLMGIYLVAVAGWPIFFIGVVSAIAAVAYTAGPFPLGYHGLGDLFVFLFFGLAAVLGTFYAHTLMIDQASVVLAIMIGLHAVALIAVNNIRDIVTDKKAGKKTLAVRMGEANSKVYYYFCVFLPYILVVAFSVQVGSFFPLLALGTLPVAIKLANFVANCSDSHSYIKALEETGKLQVQFAFLLAASLFLVSV